MCMVVHKRQECAWLCTSARNVHGCAWVLQRNTCTRILERIHPLTSSILKLHAHVHMKLYQHWQNLCASSNGKNLSNFNFSQHLIKGACGHHTYKLPLEGYDWLKRSWCYHGNSKNNYLCTKQQLLTKQQHFIESPSKQTHPVWDQEYHRMCLWW